MLSRHGLIAFNYQITAIVYRQSISPAGVLGLVLVHQPRGNEMFAKLYETEDHGQILVKMDSGDDGPEIRFFFQPDNLGVCSVAIGYEDDDSGWDKAEEAFNNVVDEYFSVKLVSETKTNAGI